MSDDATPADAATAGATQKAHAETLARGDAAAFGPEDQIYRHYSAEEDRQRTNVHYEQPVEFFYTLTGGEWNVYSGNTWNRATTETESQEEKLDLLAGLMELRPGMRILDVGCGWGGPLVYLSKTYGVEGVGLTLSPLQKAAADERIARYGAKVTVLERNWKDYTDDVPFDAVYTDEVIVHFADLDAYFAKVHGLLRPGGIMLNKELHFAHSRLQEDDPGDGVHQRALRLDRQLPDARRGADAGGRGRLRPALDRAARPHAVRPDDRPLDRQHQGSQGVPGGTRRSRRRSADSRSTCELCHHILGSKRMTLEVVVAQKPVEVRGRRSWPARGSGDLSSARRASARDHCLVGRGRLGVPGGEPFRRPIELGQVVDQPAARLLGGRVEAGQLEDPPVRQERQ